MTQLSFKLTGDGVTNRFTIPVVFLSIDTVTVKDTSGTTVALPALTNETTGVLFTVALPLGYSASITVTSPVLPVLPIPPRTDAALDAVFATDAQLSTVVAPLVSRVGVLEEAPPASVEFSRLVTVDLATELVSTSFGSGDTAAPTYQVTPGDAAHITLLLKNSDDNLSSQTPAGLPAGTRVALPDGFTGIVLIENASLTAVSIVAAKPAVPAGAWFGSVAGEVRLQLTKFAVPPRTIVEVVPRYRIVMSLTDANHDPVTVRDTLPWPITSVVTIDLRVPTYLPIGSLASAPAGTVIAHVPTHYNFCYQPAPVAVMTPANQALTLTLTAYYFTGGGTGQTLAATWTCVVPANGRLSGAWTLVSGGNPVTTMSGYHSIGSQGYLKLVATSYAVAPTAAAAGIYMNLLTRIDSSPSTYALTASVGA